MSDLKCMTCEETLAYSGRGRRPLYCAPHKRTANIAKTIQARKRNAAHGRGETYGKWGELWLIDGKAVKRKISPSYSSGDGKAHDHGYPVLGLFDDNRRSGIKTKPEDESLLTATATGVLEPLGAHGAHVGTSTTHADLSFMVSLRKGEANDHEWHKANKGWWRFESFANHQISFDVRQEVKLHGQEYSIDLDQTTLDDWGDYFDSLPELDFHALRVETINRKRARNGLAPIKGDKMEIPITIPKVPEPGMVRLTSMRQDLGVVENIFTTEWTDTQMFHLVRMRQSGFTFRKMAREFGPMVGDRTPSALARKYNRLVQQGRLDQVFFSKLVG